MTEEQKCILALEQALAHNHNEYRIHELRERLMKLSIMTINDRVIVEEEDEWELLEWD
ncbi:uncharacterized protein METZ01_LOCUS150125 [marine metagenome]|uniref:Uncharacterized protein n=1 Tax=marine metagenome TaxID=408172 RepID=A0A382A7R2_9ZZZZ